MSRLEGPLHHVGQGPSTGPDVVLLGALGTTHRMWREVAEDLSRDHHVVAVDLRGHGGSPVPPGPYTAADLAGDVVALADHLGLQTFHHVGLSIGGVVGLTLGVEHAPRLRSLTVCCANPRYPVDMWRERAERVDAEGTQWLVEANRPRWFTNDFLAASPAQRERADEVLADVAATDPVGYAACCRALAGFDVTSDLAEIGTPMLVVTGGRDPGTPDDLVDLLTEGTGARHVVLEEAGHIANLADPVTFSALVRDHVAEAERG